MVVQLAKRLKRKKLKPARARLKTLNALRKEGRLIKREFKKTTATWKGAKPTFELAIGLTGEDATVLIGPGGDQEGAQKWGWLNDGTKAHKIKAKNVPNLIFKASGFTPKTKVKSFSSGPGANTGIFISTKEVDHPGIEARDWTGEIIKKRRKPFNKMMVEAVRI